MKVNKHNYILGIETTSNICGVTLLDNTKVLSSYNIDNGLTHSVTLFPLIKKVLDKNLIKASNLSLIRESNGPGSFTGIRIGIACALGLAIPYNINIEYVDTLKSLSIGNKLFAKNKSDIFISMIDAKCDRVYLSLYNNDKNEFYKKEFIVNVYELCENLNSFFLNKNICLSLIGSGAVNYKHIFKKLLKINYNISKYSNTDSKFIAYTNGIMSKKPVVNYMLKSKAERDRNV